MSLLPERFYLDNFFDDFLDERRSNAMKCDIYEKDNKYHVEMDIPGFDKKDIKVECDKGYLTITAQKEEKEEEHKDKNYIRRERRYGTYKREFYLGELDSEKINAEFKDGVLTVTVPKKEEVETKTVIEIK